MLNSDKGNSPSGYCGLIGMENDMNIFYLDKDIETCAMYHCDRHVVKMIVEYTQILSTVSHLVGLEQGYKPTHINHPCVKWAQQSFWNWSYLRELAMELCNQYKYRYGKIHKSYYVLAKLRQPELPDTKFTEPPKCMPDECKVDGVIDSYRKYYCDIKSKFAKWKSGDNPKWFNNNYKGEQNG